VSYFHRLFGKVEFYLSVVAGWSIVPKSIFDYIILFSILDFFVRIFFQDYLPHFIDKFQCDDSTY
jgi:hypothetical protein